MTILNSEIRRIRNLCKQHGIEDYHINDDYTINVNGHVNLMGSCSHMERLPLKFDKVWGDFDCRRNMLTTLEGSPRYVGGDFSCGDNELTSFEHCPSEVKCNFFGISNPLTTLEFIPNAVGHFLSFDVDTLKKSIDVDTYYTQILKIIENDAYPQYTMAPARLEMLFYPMDDFMSWYHSRQRMQTIADIINSD